MAYAALVSLAQTTDLILTYHRDFISLQVTYQIISIHEYVIFLQLFLEHFPDKANNLESIIRAVTHAAEDIIELLMLDSSVGPSNSKFNHLRSDFHELKEATEEIEFIAGIVKRMRNNMIVKDEGRGDSTAVSSSSRAGPDHKDGLVGFESDVMEIKSRLCRESSRREAIPIIGMGGIGKTTLARNVYDDPCIMEHFQIREWVTVSQDYRVEEIVSCLLISMKVFEAKSESMREEHVYKNLKGRRYLIVLDDVWSIKAWDDLKIMFPDDGNGSRILLTTRLSYVASYADSGAHEMHLMDEGLSWNLLQKKVFKQDPCPVELEYIGKKIARSCRGLPLAIVVISGILSSIDRTSTAWENIGKNVASAISANNEQFDMILALSYTHLPHHLRPCFLYMAGFPEDYEMRASILVKLLAAEGFLKHNGGDKSFEETAEEYLEDLVKRSLVLATKRKPDGRIKRLGMHDLVREMCIRIAQEDNFFKHGDVSPQQGMNIPRRVSSIPSHLAFPDGLPIRTILAIWRKEDCDPFSIPYFRLLRVLNLLDASIPHLRTQLLESLFHLRYLALWGFSTIPPGISKLQNLQSLIIHPSSSHEHFLYSPINCAPFLLDLWSLPQLRHLVICIGFCFCLPPNVQGAALCLENLQTLSLAVNFICTPEILKTIPNLKKLEICYSECRNNEKNYQLHNLKYLQRLENLKIKVQPGFPSPWKLCPDLPRTLKKLTLSGFGPLWQNMTILGSLPNLEVLKLRCYACYGNKWETKEGEFSHLKFLLIDESKLQDWITESSHFPRLERLVLHRCWCLSEIPNDIGEVPTLELIELDDKYLLKSAKQIQDDQLSDGNDSLQVRFVERKKPTYGG